MGTAAIQFLVFVPAGYKHSNHSVGEIWMKSPTSGTSSLGDREEQHPQPKPAYFLSRQLALCTTAASGGAPSIPGWILSWHRKWTNIVVSVSQCTKFHHGINKMKEAANLGQSPWGQGGRELNRSQTAHWRPPSEAVFFPPLLLLCKWTQNASCCT